MEIHDRLDDIAQLLETARAVPLSTSCVVPRNEALDLVDDARDALPEAIREADEVLAAREQLIEDAQSEADQVVAAATTQAGDLVSGAQHDADSIVDNARADADEMLDRARAEARRMIDEQEVLLRAQEEAVALLEDAQVRARSVMDDAAQRADVLIEETQAETSQERLQTDEFVDGKLADLEESLATSLTAVRRGRDRIHARRAAFDPVDLRSSTDDDALMFNQIIE